MAQQLLQPEARLLCISRKSNPDLQTRADAAGAVLEQWSADLADGAPVAQQLTDWLNALDPRTLASATLINNAGVLAPLVAVRDSDPSALAQALRVGVEAPLQLCAAFLGATRNWAVPRKVLNISSGLGRRAMASSAAYCAARWREKPSSEALARRPGEEASGSAPGGSPASRHSSALAPARRSRFCSAPALTAENSEMPAACSASMRPAPWWRSAWF